MVVDFFDSKLRDSQIDLHQLQPSQLHVTFTTTTNTVQIDDIYMYVENEEGEYDHLHSSRPKQVVSEREDE